MLSRKLLLVLFTITLAVFTLAAPVAENTHEHHGHALASRAIKGRPAPAAKAAQKPLKAPAARPAAGKKGAAPTRKNHCKRTSPFHSGSGAITLYRGIPVNEKSYNPVGGSPTGYSGSAGDFSPQGGYYMFASLEDAKFWANMRAYYGSATQYSVVTLKYTPSASVKVKEFRSDDAAWKKFVKHNYSGGSRVSPDASGSELYDFIIGPMSQGSDPIADQSQVDCGSLFQYVAVDKKALAALKVEKVQDFTYKEKWLEGGKEPK